MTPHVLALQAAAPAVPHPVLPGCYSPPSPCSHPPSLTPCVCLCRDQAARDSLDGIINTVSAPHDLVPLMGMMKRDGKCVLVGAPEVPFTLPSFALIFSEWQKVQTACSLACSPHPPPCLNPPSLLSSTLFAWWLHTSQMLIPRVFPHRDPPSTCAPHLLQSVRAWVAA